MGGGQGHQAVGGVRGQQEVPQEPGGGVAARLYATRGQPEVPQEPGGGIAARLYTTTSRNDMATIEQELDWQGRVESDATKCSTFRDQALNQTTFRAFAFMKSKSPVVHMAHSIGQFFGMTGLALDIQGKHIDLIGGRGN